MANQPIPTLPSAIGLSGDEQIEIVQPGGTNGTSKQTTVSAIGTYVASTYPVPSITSISTSSPLKVNSGNGPVSSGAVSLKIAEQGIGNSLLAPMAAYTVKANVTSGPAVPTDATVTSVLNTISETQGSVLYRGASQWLALSPGTNGYVLATGGTGANPSWVAQVAYDPANVTITGGTINNTVIGGSTPAAGTFTTLSATTSLTLSNALTVPNGGTGATTFTNKGVLYGNGTSAVGATAAGTTGQALLGVTGSAPSWGAVNLTTTVTGVLPVANGGTNFSSYTTGDLLYADSSSTLARLNDVQTGNALISGGVGVAPSWGKIDLTTHVSGTLPVANGGTGITSFGTGVATALGQNVTGSGGIVLATSPTLATPNLGTPSAAVLTNATGLPLTTGVTGTLPVGSGGTGATTLTGYLIGNGTSAFTTQATIPNSGLTNSSVTIGSTSIALGATASTISGLTTLTLTQDPTAALQASTKQYVDNTVATVANLTYHTAVEYATTADLGTVTYNNGTGGVGATLTNAGAQAALQIDGHTFDATDVANAVRVLVKNETSGAYNGAYVVTNEGSGSTNWELTRATDFDTVGSGPTKIQTGAAFFVSSGTINGSTSWVLTTTGTITVGSTALTFTQNSASGSILVNAPLTKSGNTISLGTVTVPFGGTGLTTLTQYAVMLGAGTGNVAFASPGTTGYPLLSNGASANPSFGQLSLTTGVTGTLPVANGGTGITSFGTGVATALGQNVTGSGGIVLATSPTLTTPNLGTPSALTLTNATGLPLTTGVTGTLPVANGGTGTSTAFTTGSIVFSGASGVYTQNNSKFFWDNTNYRLGLNTASPNTTLTIVSNTQTATPISAASLPAGTDLYILGADAANTRITQDAYGSGNYSAYTGRQARGTAASPIASQTGDILVEFTGRGYGATGFALQSIGRIDIEAAENFTDSAQGTYISIHTTALGATSPTERFRVGPSGQFGIGGATYGTSGYVLTSAGASAAPTWSQVSLSAGVTGTLPATNGGTGQSSYAVGDLLYADTTTSLAKLADIATGNALISGGVGVAPSWGKIGLTTHVSGQLPLANGGTNANLTASNGGIFYSTATAGAILSGTATANQVLLSGSSAAPAWSTATYPATTTVNQLLYSSSNNVIAGLSTANSSVLVTDGSGVPSLSTNLPKISINSATLGTNSLAVSGNTAIVSGSFGLSGNISAPTWGTSGIRYANTAATLTDTSTAGTVATAYTDFFGNNTIAATNARTFTDYATMFIGTPQAGTNVTLTNAWSIITGGNVKAGGLITNTSTSANALAIGPNGTTNPSLNVDASTASAATGLNVKSAAAGAGLAVSVISSGSNENLTIDAKGTGTIGIGTVSTGVVTITSGGVAPQGTGAYVRATSPTLTTPALGVATATSINKVAITAPATSATLTIADGKTLTVSKTLTLDGTDSTTMTFPSTSATIARTDAAQTFTGAQTYSNAVIYTNNAITASSNAATIPITAKLNTVTNNSAATLTITMTTTSATDGQMTIVRIYDFSAVAQTITWVNTENSTVIVPATSNGSTTLPLTVGFMYNSATSKWRCIASA